MAEVVEPGPDAGNSSATVGRIVRDGGGLGGSLLTLDAPLDSSEPVHPMKVWSQRQGVRIKLKLECRRLSYEVDQWNTTLGGWEEMHWNFTNALSMTFDKLVFMFDFETTGDGSDESTFYFDDIEQVDASAASPSSTCPARLRTRLWTPPPTTSGARPRRSWSTCPTPPPT